VLRQAPDDEVLRSVILFGLPNAGMPSISGSATPAELTKLIAYVRSLGTLPVERVSGDAERGRGIYSGRAACSRCHMVSGNGGILGPELTSIGATRGSAYLRTAIVDPARELPAGPGMPYPGSGHARFLLVRVTHRDGRRISGIRLNEDGFTIQVRDTQGRLFSFEKNELTSLEKILHGSLMPPSGGALSPIEIDDVIAYLLTLRGTP
jgi:putative heme-binding domain-containing protein